MDDEDVDFDLLELLRQRLGINTRHSDEVSSDTGVLRDAEFIYNNAVDVSIDMWSTKMAAAKIAKIIQERGYSMAAWSEHELHPKLGQDVNEVEMANFIFTMDLLNFSFWSDLPQAERFQVEYQGKRYTGYMSLVASLQRALAEGVPITTPRFWRSSAACTDNIIRHVFRSATNEEIPLLDQRIAILREAGHGMKDYDDDDDEEEEEEVRATEELHQEQQETSRESETLHETAHETSYGTTVAPPTQTGDNLILETNEVQAEPESIDSATLHAPTYDVAKFKSGTDASVKRFILKAEKSAGKLVNLLYKHFSSFRDECRYEGRRVRLLKRAQICVADLNAACNNTGIGEFLDMDSLSMFADYRVPQILHRFGVLSYCPALAFRIQDKLPLEHAGSWEVQIRGCSIWATELLRREIAQHHGGGGKVNAVLIDFLLYDLAKELEFEKESVPHHRTRSIYY